MARPRWSERTENEPWDWGRSWLDVPVELFVPVVEVWVSLVLAFEVVKIVIARSGIVLSPVFATERVRVVFSASVCLLGKSALTIWTGKLPDGSSTSWRSPPPQPEMPAAERATRSPIPRQLRTL